MSAIERLLQDYKNAAEQHARGDAEITNRWYGKIHECYKLLRDTTEGRQGISALMSDPIPHVRLWAASHSLAWQPDYARKTLEEIRDSESPSSFDAKWTLKMYDAGQLSFDND